MADSTVSVGSLHVVWWRWDSSHCNTCEINGRRHENQKQTAPSISREYTKHYLSFVFLFPSLGKKEVVPMDFDNTSPSLLNLDSRWVSLRDSLLGADVVGDTFRVPVVAALPPEKLLVQSLYFRIGILSVSVVASVMLAKL